LRNVSSSQEEGAYVHCVVTADDGQDCPGEVTLESDDLFKFLTSSEQPE
jgi:hypothetical protein